MSSNSSYTSDVENYAVSFNDLFRTPPKEQPQAPQDKFVKKFKAFEHQEKCLEVRLAFYHLTKHQCITNIVMPQKYSIDAVSVCLNLPQDTVKRCFQFMIKAYKGKAVPKSEIACRNFYIKILDGEVYYPRSNAWLTGKSARHANRSVRRTNKLD